MFNFFALTIMIHKYYYLFTRPSVIVVCWKSIFFKSLQFFQGRIIWITFGWGIGGRNFMLVRGENLPMKYPWGNLGGQVENVCPLGAEKGQSLPISALRWFSTDTWIFADKMKKNHTNLFTPSLFTLSIYEIIYSALFKDYQILL